MFLQRHGESEANVSRVFACRNLDPNLTQKGKRQIEEAADFYKLMTIDKIFSSPSARAGQTAEIISNKINVECTIDECLLEIDVGDIEGQSGRDPKELNFIINTVTEWVTNGGNTSFPGGESRDKVMERVSRAVSLLSPSTILIGHLAFFLLVLWKLKIPFNNVNDLVIPQGGRAQYNKSNGQWEIIRPVEQSN